MNAMRKDVWFFCLMIGIIIGLIVGSIPRQVEVHQGSIEVYKGYVMNPSVCTPLNGTFMTSYNPEVEQTFPSNSIIWEEEVFNITIYPYNIRTSLFVQVNLTIQPFVWLDGEFVVIITN